MITTDKKIILAAGGTGGHLFPAKALATELIKRGYKVDIITDKRALKLVHDFDGATIHVVRSATIKGKNPKALIKTLSSLILGAWQSYRIIRKIKPDVVGGFGGYPTLPPMVVATSLIGKAMRVKSFIHEQNAIMGRANKFLSSRVDAIAAGFLEKTAKLAPKFVETGNPVRKEILKYSSFLYKLPNERGFFNLLVFGGSQGASFFSKIMPQALAILDISYRKRLKLVQQSRNDSFELQKQYEKLSINAQIAPFFIDLAEKMAEAHFIISRSGASTVSEISVIGRPALLVPYPHAIDNDQEKNASYLVNCGAGLIYQQKNLTPEILASIIKDMMDNPKKLLDQAKVTKKAGKPNATQELAKLVEDLIK